MSEPRWEAVDRYLTDLLVGADPVLEAALAANAAAGLPPIDVSPPLGRLLELLVRLRGARRVLELGALGGYSTIWLARGLPADGRLLSLELNPDYAAVARANLERAGLAERVELRVGPALASMRRLLDGREGLFDLIFIDADKETTPDYFATALELSRVGTLIVTDNVVRGGALVEEDAADPRVHGMRSFVERLAREPRVLATVLQTVGSKGYDGFALALVTSSDGEAAGGGARAG